MNWLIPRSYFLYTGTRLKLIAEFILIFCHCLLFASDVSSTVFFFGGGRCQDKQHCQNETLFCIDLGEKNLSLKITNGRKVITSADARRKQSGTPFCVSASLTFHWVFSPSILKPVSCFMHPLHFLEPFYCLCLDNVSVLIFHKLIFFSLLIFQGLEPTEVLWDAPNF